jgi:hypothetical protein
MTVLIAPIVDWYCPQCGQTDQTREARPHSRFHRCPKLRGLEVPMLEAGTKAKVELREWQDYVGKERVQRDPEMNRPVQSVVTTRDNGQDVAVYAPVATMDGSM